MADKNFKERKERNDAMPNQIVSFCRIIQCILDGDEETVNQGFVQ